MLELLHIENIAVIRQADITFRPGFNALTGETGAGKSIVPFRPFWGSGPIGTPSAPGLVARLSAPCSTGCPIIPGFRRIPCRWMREKY